MYKEIIRLRLSEQAWEIRRKMGWSQERMSEQMRITTRAYGDLERGRYCFSSSSLLFLLELIGKEETWKLVIEVCAEVHQREERGELEESGSALPCGMRTGRL